MPQSKLNMHYVQLMNSGKAYLASNPAGSIGGMDWCSLITGNVDTTIQSLGLPLNTTANNSDFYLARDESFIILIYGTAEKSCNGYLDLFVAYKKNDQTWTNPKNLGVTINVRNAADGRWGPYVTADKNYLFYSRGTSPSDGGICWVRLGNLLDSLRQANFAPYVKTQIPPQSDTAGRFFSFRIPDSTFIDDDGNNTLTYSAALSNGSALPAWLSFNPASRTFSGTPNSAGAINAAVTATDTAGARVSCTFSLLVIANTGVKDMNNFMPEEIRLDANYPNPFNPSTMIGYQLPVFSSVRLTIYNLLGEKIKTFQNGFQPAGKYLLLWDATDERNNPVSSGMYVYRLETNEKILQKKMLLLK